VFKGLGALLYLLSLVVLWCEITIAVPYNLSPIGYSVMAVIPYGSLWAEIVMLVPLAYMSFCTYRSLALFKIPCVQSFSMHPDRQTHAYALLFNAAYVCRLQFTLGFNFLNTLQITNQDQRWIANDFHLPDCGFKKVVGEMDVFPVLGDSFFVFFPAITLFVAAFMIFNLHRTIFHFLKIEDILAFVPEVGSSEYNERLKEGALLVQRAESRRHRAPSSLVRSLKPENSRRTPSSNGSSTRPPRTLPGSGASLKPKSPLSRWRGGSSHQSNQSAGDGDDFLDWRPDLESSQPLEDAFAQHSIHDRGSGPRGRKYLGGRYSYQRV